MSQQVEGILLEGTADSITWQFQGSDPHAVVKLFDRSEKIVTALFPPINPGDRIRAVCLAKPNPDGHYQAVDLIHNENRRPISDEQRSDQARRMGLRPIYESPRSIATQPVIGRITEIQVELIAYLQRHPELLQEMHSEAFEKLVAELMASHGFDVEWTGRNRKTAGDVHAFKTDVGLGLFNNYLVECKRYGLDKPVGIEIARALYGAKHDEGFANALLVTTSRFQSGVEQFAIRHWDFQTKDFDGLVEWLNRYRPMAGGRLHMEERRLVIDDYKK